MVPCNVDIATVGIIHDARQADPQGQRTIGVLTKPDLIPRVRAFRKPTTCACRMATFRGAECTIHTAGYRGVFGPLWADFPLPYP